MKTKTKPYLLTLAATLLAQAVKDVPLPEKLPLRAAFDQKVFDYLLHTDWLRSNVSSDVRCIASLPFFVLTIDITDAENSYTERHLIRATSVVAANRCVNALFPKSAFKKINPDKWEDLPGQPCYRIYEITNLVKVETISQLFIAYGLM